MLGRMAVDVYVLAFNALVGRNPALESPPNSMGQVPAWATEWPINEPPRTLPELREWFRAALPTARAILRAANLVGA